MTDADADNERIQAAVGPFYADEVIAVADASGYATRLVRPLLLALYVAHALLPCVAVDQER